MYGTVGFGLSSFCVGISVFCFVPPLPQFLSEATGWWFSRSNLFNETGNKLLNPSGHTRTLLSQYWDYFTSGFVSVLQSELTLLSRFGEIVTRFEQQEKDMTL